jgi:hypothetical protein
MSFFTPDILSISFIHSAFNPFLGDDYSSTLSNSKLSIFESRPGWPDFKYQEIYQQKSEVKGSKEKVKNLSFVNSFD